MQTGAFSPESMCSTSGFVEIAGLSCAGLSCAGLRSSALTDDLRMSKPRKRSSISGVPGGRCPRSADRRVDVVVLAEHPDDLGERRILQEGQSTRPEVVREST